MNHIRLPVALLLSALAHPLTAAPVEQTVLTEGSANIESYGSALALSGDTLVVGKPGPNSNTGTGTGAAYVYVRSGGAWAQQAVLTAANADAGDRFGESVAISGDLIIVGASREASSVRGNGDPTDNSLAQAGAAYIFKRSGTTWTQQAYLKAPNTRTRAYFGSSVAISGTTAVVGTGMGKPLWQGPYPNFDEYSENGGSTGVDGDDTNFSAAASGATYVFSLHGSQWRCDAYLKASNTGAYDLFGYAVGIDGDLIVVGAPAESSAAVGVNGNQSDNSFPVAGAAYVFARDANGRWAQEAYLKSSVVQTPSQYDMLGIGFGGALAVQGNTVAIGVSGAYDEHREGDRVWIFTRSPAGVWTQQQALAPQVPGSILGYSIALSGDTLVVGQIFEGWLFVQPPIVNKGGAHVFTRNAGVWTRQAVVVPGNLANHSGAGYAVAADGGTFVVGCGSAFLGALTGGDNRAWIYTGAGGPNISAEQPAGTTLASGGTRTHGLLPGMGGDIVFTIRNSGTQPLALTGAPNRVALSGSSDFSITAQPPGTVSPGGSTTFTAHFAPITAGLKTATLTIPSDDPDTSPYVINLSGRGLSFTTDTDGDGMSDAAEFQIAALGFDWQASQAPLVANYFASANGNGLYTSGQLQALHPGAAFTTRDAATGKFKLQLELNKSTDLTNFIPFPFTPAGTSVTGEGKVQFEFTAPDNAAFYRLDSR